MLYITFTKESYTFQKGGIDNEKTANDRFTHAIYSILVIWK